MSATLMTVGCVAMFLYLFTFVLKATNNELMHGVWGGGICILTGFAFGIQTGRKNKARYISLAVMSVLSALTAIPLAYFAGDGAAKDAEFFNDKYGQVVCNALLVVCAGLQLAFGFASMCYGILGARTCNKLGLK